MNGNLCRPVAMGSGLLLVGGVKDFVQVDDTG